MLTWKKQPDELARKYETNHKEVLVAQGHQAILVTCKQTTKVLTSGIHRLANNRWVFSWQTLSHHVVFLEKQDCELVFSLANLVSQEGWRVQVSVALTIKITEPWAFFQQVIKNKLVVTLNDLQQYLYPEVNDALEEILQQTTHEALIGSVALKERLEAKLREHLKFTLRRGGMDLIQIRSLRIHNPTKTTIDAEHIQQSYHNNLVASTQRQEQKQELSFTHELEEMQLIHQLKQQQRKLEFELYQQEQKYHGKEREDFRKLHAHLQRKKMRIKHEGEIAEIASQTQNQRTLAALELKKQIALYQKEIAKIKKRNR